MPNLELVEANIFGCCLGYAFSAVLILNNAKKKIGFLYNLFTFGLDSDTCIHRDTWIYRI